MYVGTLKEIKVVLQTIKPEIINEDSISSLAYFISGNVNSTYSMETDGMALLSEVDFIDNNAFYVGALNWEHRNTWGFTYMMKFDAAEIKRMIIRHDGKVYRLIKAKMMNLSYSVPHREWNKLDGGFWGNSFVIKVSYDENDNFYVETLLYVIEEQVSENETYDFSENITIIFNSICDEIFGDG